MLRKYTMTCNCYEPPIREDVTVTSSSVYSAFDAAKEKFSKKHHVKVEDVAITALHNVEVH